MDSGRIAKLFQNPVIDNDPILVGLLREADAMQEAILFAPDFFYMTTEYVGERIQQISGYSVEEWTKGGIPLAVGTTLQSEFNRLGALQSSYVQQAKSEGFDARAIVIQEYEWIMVRKNGAHTSLSSAGVILSYTPEMDFRLGIGFMIPQPHHDETIARCKSLLRRIKSRHNEIYAHSPPVVTRSSYLMNYTHVESSSVTSRQREVLSLLAKGLSTKIIADKLNISNHTVESHRKSLLEKFEAKNVAELIMKASKIFWFE